MLHGALTTNSHKSLSVKPRGDAGDPSDGVGEKLI